MWLTFLLIGLSLNEALLGASNCRVMRLSSGLKASDTTLDIASNGVTGIADVYRRGEHDRLVRAFKGAKTERTPVWLLRQ